MTPEEKAWYTRAAQEIAEKSMDPGVYAKAFAVAEGNKDRALALYIQYRVEELAYLDELSRKAEAEKVRAERDQQRIRVPAKQWARRLGCSEMVIIDGIKAGQIVGGKEAGEWYVLVKPEGV